MAMTQSETHSKELKLRPRRQLTLPNEICEQLGLEVGGKLRVAVEGDRLVAWTVKNSALDALKEIRRLFRQSGLTEGEVQQVGRQVRERLSDSRYGRKG